MAGLYSDPHGEKIFSGTTATEHTQSRTEITLAAAKEMGDAQKKQGNGEQGAVPSTQV